MQKRQYRFKEDSYVRCPYYRKENSLEIRCASCIGGRNDTTWFRTVHSKDEYKEDFCVGNFYGCIKYQILAEEEDDAHGKAT